MIRDVLIVVLSILVAFSLDAWWNQRLERRDERDVLESLSVEMQTNRRQLETTLEIHNWVLEAANSILLLTGPAAAAPGDPVALERGLMELLYDATYNPSFGALSALTRRVVSRSSRTTAYRPGWRAGPARSRICRRMSSRCDESSVSNSCLS